MEAIPSTDPALALKDFSQAHGDLTDWVWWITFLGSTYVLTSVATRVAVAVVTRQASFGPGVVLYRLDGRCPEPRIERVFCPTAAGCERVAH